MGSLVLDSEQKEPLLSWSRDIRTQLDPAWFTNLSVHRRDRLFFGMQVALIRLQSYGAWVTKHLHHGVTHVLVSDGVYNFHRSQQPQASQSQSAQILQRTSSSGNEARYVEARWSRLQERLRRLRLLDETDLQDISSSQYTKNKEKRIVPTVWVDHIISKQRALVDSI